MLKAELGRLKKVERPANVKDIEVAREHGDISENAEFHAAKERQAFIDGRIRDISSKISRAEVIDPSKLNVEHVVFGAKVKLEDAETGDLVTYRIVGEDEAKVENGMINVASPLARALIGKNLDEQVQVKTPGGVKEFIIMDITFD